MLKTILAGLALSFSAFLPLAIDLSTANAAEEKSFRPLDMNLSDYAYPYDVSFYDFEAQGQKLRMAYMDVPPAKDTANGKTVVLLHGKNFSGSYWQRTIADLTTSGYRVIVPDQIGFGKSTKPEHLQYSFHALSQWTDALVQKAGASSYDLIGHSMGGMLATRMALLYPDRVQKLVLVNPIGLEDWKRSMRYVSVDEWYQNELKATPDTFRNYQKNVYFDGQWRPDYETLIEIPSGWTAHKDYPRVAWNSALIYDMIMTQPVVYEFGDLKVPTLLLIGTRDTTAVGKNFVTDEKKRAELGRYDLLGKKTAKAIPNAKLVEFENVGHMPQIEVYDDYIANIKSFLAK